MRSYVIGLLRALVILISTMGSYRMSGQEKPVSLPRPLYPLPRYEEDWSFLRDPSERNDFWDPVKFVPLSDDERVFLSLGGEVRGAYERFHNTNFGLSPQDPGGYLLQRYLFHADLHAGSRFRLFGELSSSLEDGRAGGPRPVVDKNKLDIHQGFFDVLLGRPRSDPSLTIRLGRQEIALGSGRLVALREGANVAFSFDGVHVALRWAVWSLDGLATRPVQSKPGVFDDPPQHDFAFWPERRRWPFSVWTSMWIS
jgi:Alginate export